MTPRAALAAAAVAGLLLASRPAVAQPPDALLAEIQGHFHATRKWFGMVSDLAFDRGSDSALAPRFETLRSQLVLRHDAAGQTLSARLPEAADGIHVVTLGASADFFVRTKEIGAAPARAEVHRGVIVYRNAVAGGDLLYKLTPTHVDEYLYLRDPPTHLTRRLEFDTGAAVSALREAGDWIEVLGKDGIARLRLGAPLARAADGARRRGTARVEGRVIVEDIDLTGLAAPILVDPDWTTTGTMTVSQWGDAAWLRPDGRVMAMGGCALTACPTSFASSACGQVLASSEVWDPASGTWTTAPTMLTARTGFAGVPLSSGDMLVSGGCTATNCTQVNDAGACLATICAETTALSERFSIASGAWIAAGALASARANPMGAAIGGGDAIVAGGCDVAACTADTERWSATKNAWSARAALAAPRGYATATTLADGRVLVIGGCADPACATVLGDATVYDPAADAWSDAGSMTSPRAGHTATLLDDGSVLVAGGCSDRSCATALSSVEIWTASGAFGGSFALAPAMAGARHSHTATRLLSGEVLIAGGDDQTGATVPTSEVYLPHERAWVPTTAMLMARAYHIAVALANGEVLVGGGCNPQTCIPWAEVFSPASLPPDADGGVPPDASPSSQQDGGSGAIDAGLPPPPASPHPPLYRTGIVTCATDDTQDLACPSAGYELEDGDFKPDTQSFTRTGDDEVTDATTGLVWQASDDGQTYDHASATQHCAALATASTAAGSWRLPSVVELMTINDYGEASPSIAAAFTGARSTNYWASTPVVSTQTLAWTVKFDGGEVIPLLMETNLPVRCVRGTSSILRSPGAGLRKAGAFDAGPLTVRDATTGLEWQRRDDGTKRSWKDALSYCARLPLGGKSGWHLPNVSELLGIVQYDATHDGVAIDTAFQTARADLYWTSSQNEGSPSASWGVMFNLGSVDGVSVNGLGYARCVRHIEPPGAAGSEPVAVAVRGSSCGCVLGPGARDGAAAGGGDAGGSNAAAVVGLLAIAAGRLRRRPSPASMAPASKSEVAERARRTALRQAALRSRLEADN